MTATPRPADRRDTIGWGVILIAVGLGTIALQLFPGSGAVILLAIGLGLLVLFAIDRRYGALIPGSIMTGLGAGILASDLQLVAGVDNGGVIVTGLGLGFLGIWVIGAIAHVVEHHPWPLIPGGILTTVGVALMLGGPFEDVIVLWPLFLVALGVFILVRAMNGRHGEGAPR